MKRSRLALSLVLGILAALATVDRWPIGGRGVAADLPITLADRLCPADFADDRVCTEPFQWFGESGNRRAVVHTARANVVTPWRPTAPSESSATVALDVPPICPAETPSEPAEPSGGFTCGFELDYVLALARYMISGEPSWAMSQGATPATMAASSTPTTDESANLQAWLCPQEDAAEDDEATDGDDSNQDGKSDRAGAAPAVAGPLAASDELVPAADLAFDCTAPDFNYGSPAVASLDSSADSAVDDSLDMAVIDRAAIEAASAADEAELIAADLQSICPAAAARYNCGSPQACDPVIAAELGLAPRTTLEWWGAAGDNRADAPRSNRNAALQDDDGYDCTASTTTTSPASAPVVGSLANVLADIRERRDLDFGMQLNAEVDAIAEWSNSIPAETAAVEQKPIAAATAGDECGFAEPATRHRAETQAVTRAEIRAEIADAYFGAADLLFAGLNSQQSTTTYPGDVIDAQRVISGAIDRAADNLAADDYPSDATDSVLFETLLAGPTRFVYLRKLPPSRWTMPIDWRAESLRVWDGGQGRWPFAAPAMLAPSAQSQPLMVRQQLSDSPRDRAITWPCLSADWTYVEQTIEQDVAINQRAIEQAKTLQRNALRLAADCSDCLRALAGGIDAFARSLTLGQLDGLRSAALPQRALPNRDEFRTAPQIDAPAEPTAVDETMPERASPEPRVDMQNWGIYLGL